MTMAGNSAERTTMDPYRQRAEAVLAALHVDARSGLGRGEAERRLEQYGRNELTEEKPVPGWRKFLAQFTDALVILLIVAGLVSAACGFTSATPRFPMRRWRSSRSFCSTPSWATSSRHGRSRR